MEPVRVLINNVFIWTPAKVAWIAFFIVLFPAGIMWLSVRGPQPNATPELFDSCLTNAQVGMTAPALRQFCGHIGVQPVKHDASAGKWIIRDGKRSATLRFRYGKLIGFR